MACLAEYESFVTTITRLLHREQRLRHLHDSPEDSTSHAFTAHAGGSPTQVVVVDEVDPTILIRDTAPALFMASGGDRGFVRGSNYGQSASSFSQQPV
ncbi:hypothetical protein CRG98_019066 [Punica granatum]|uniref:Uncharacterized protein n=1 Tax=Punica granatum TaxID=22663 RepID=A0A2I0JXL2_PUNGR|nr:hypothetical protein CRG98_019066 [Punica granatum]